jgi:hypothetical protein
MENDAKGLLILILPFALVVSLLITAWPLIVLAIAFSVGWRLWQEYQWQQLSIAINPDFRRLIENNQGKITVADLALETGLTGASARWFLNRKAKEYGAQAIAYGNMGIIYYFLTVTALGNMFDDSDPEFELEAPYDDLNEPYSSPNDIAKLLNIDTTPQNLGDISSLVALNAALNLGSLIQADLAKRLNVHPSTLRKRREEADFSAWSQEKDPHGIPWRYDPKTKQFLPKI